MTHDFLLLSLVDVVGSRIANFDLVRLELLECSYRFLSLLRFEFDGSDSLCSGEKAIEEFASDR